MMKLKRIAKWTATVIFLGLVVTTFIIYWTSTNECDRKTGAPANPMKAIVDCEYGSPDVLKFEDVEKPVPDDNQLLIRVRAASLNALDVYLIRDTWFVRLIIARGLSVFVDQRFAQYMTRNSKPDLIMLGDLMQAGKLRPVVERTYKLHDASEAFRQLDRGHARGKLVVTME